METRFDNYYALRNFLDKLPAGAGRDSQEAQAGLSEIGRNRARFLIFRIGCFPSIMLSAEFRCGSRSVRRATAPGMQSGGLGPQFVSLAFRILTDSGLEPRVYPRVLGLLLRESGPGQTASPEGMS